MRQFRSHIPTFPLCIYGHVFHRYGYYYEHFQGIKPAAQSFPGNLGGHTQGASRSLSQQPHRPRNGRPPVLPPSPSPRPERSRFALGSDREMLGFFSSPILSPFHTAARLRLPPAWSSPTPRAEPRRCRGSAGTIALNKAAGVWGA